jgi:O-acetyl-ADP-ribose deacetylase (regulator of RNase III)
LVVIITAGIFLALCLVTLRWATRPSATGIRHTLFVFVWLCAALTATLVTFSVFPSTSADGTVFSVTLGGAGAFVILVWTAALRAGNRAADRDARESAAARKAGDAAVRRNSVKPGPVVLDRQETYWYLLRNTSRSKKRWIGIVTGDIRRIHDVDAWINSENTDMMMARIHDFSTSGIIRYEGATRDTTGRVVADLIAEELALAVRDRRPVTPGIAIVTSAGELTRSHGVKFVIHTAAVEGEPGEGYRPIRDLDGAVSRALSAAAHPTLHDGTGLESASSVLFPLIGTGTAGGDLEMIARTLLLAAVDHLARSAEPAPERVLFLAYTDTELAACRSTLETCGELKRQGMG